MRSTAFIITGLSGSFSVSFVPVVSGKPASWSIRFVALSITCSDFDEVAAIPHHLLDHDSMEPNIARKARIVQLYLPDESVAPLDDRPGYGAKVGTLKWLHQELQYPLRLLLRGNSQDS